MTDLTTRPLSEIPSLDAARVLAAAFDSDSLDEWTQMVERERTSPRLCPQSSRVRLANGRPVAVCLASAGPTPNRGRIGATGVRPDHQGQGHGTAVVADAVGALDHRARTSITLEVEPNNPRAIALYTRLGFTPGRRLTNLSGRRSDLTPGRVVAQRTEPSAVLAHLSRLHPETPAFQRTPEYIATFDTGVVAHFTGPPNAPTGAILQRGRALLDIAAHPCDPDIVRALVWAAADLAWEQRLINVVDDDPVGHTLLDLGFTTESEALEMVRR